jgi:hypothetical protein
LRLTNLGTGKPETLLGEAESVWTARAVVSGAVQKRRAERDNKIATNRNRTMVLKIASIA